MTPHTTDRERTEGSSLSDEALQRDLENLFVTFEATASPGKPQSADEPPTLDEREMQRALRRVAKHLAGKWEVKDQLIERRLRACAEHPDLTPEKAKISVLQNGTIKALADMTQVVRAKFVEGTADVDEHNLLDHDPGQSAGTEREHNVTFGAAPDERTFFRRWVQRRAISYAELRLAKVNEDSGKEGE